jgi:hypothetical protein
MITDSWAITRTVAKEADQSTYGGNGNGLISMKEVSNFATMTDPAATSTLTYHEHPQYASKNYADNGATKYLHGSTCTSPKSIRLGMPYGTEVWWTGGTLTTPFTRDITWAQGGISSDTVLIQLYNNTDGKYYPLATAQPASALKWTWPMPPTGTQTLKAGTLVYKVYITDNQNTAVKDSSKRPFTIKTGGMKSTIVVSSTPGGATIYLDGVKQAPTTTTAGVPLSGIVPGTHTVTLTLGGYLDEAKGFDLTSNSNSPGYPVSITLDPATDTSGKNAVDDKGRMGITSTIYGADVLIDDNLEGTTPFEREIIPGTDWDNNYPHVYKVKVKAFGYLPEEGKEKDVIVGRGWIVNEDFELTPQPWLLTFDGFFDPIVMGTINQINTRKTSTLPMKWHLSDANGDVTTDRFVNIMSYQVDCIKYIGDPLSAVKEGSSGSSGLQNLGDGNWQFNLEIKKDYAGSCRKLYALFDYDQKSPEVTFKFR